ncbi:IS5 family transposase [Pelagibacterium nitratireducens]|uniref:IS5 family transposase n=1 Tax=Pelagibacterium nitratireducens TaxID=1046114 RepID=A0ABZ2I1R3_9HYPH
MARFDLSDFEWELIQPCCRTSHGGWVDDRRVLNGIFWVLRTGSPWRDLPERYGPSTTVYNRFNRWAKAGVWVRVFEELAEKSPDSMQFIDSSIIRAHQHAASGKKGGADHAIGRSRGGLSTKINAMVDANGLPVAITLAPGQASDKAAVPALLATQKVIGDVVADRGYDARAILELIAQRGGRGHIPTQKDRKAQRSIDPAIYRQRNLVERFFNKLKHFRKIATRYEKTEHNYLAAVLIACSRLWMRFHESAT